MTSGKGLIFFEATTPLFLLVVFVVVVWCPHCNSPPIVFLIPRVQDQAACVADVSFELIFFIEMVIAMKCFCGFTIICSSSSSSMIIASHDPRDHHVLLVAFVPASATGLLLERPHVDQCLATLARFGGRLQRLEDFAYSVDSSFGCRKMVDDRDGNGKVEKRRGMR